MVFQTLITEKTIKNGKTFYSCQFENLKSVCLNTKPVHQHNRYTRDMFVAD